MNLGKDKSKVQPRVCSKCRLLKHCVDPVTGVCIDCHEVVEGSLGPPLDIMADDTADGTEPVNERLKRFVQAVANQANWDERRPDSGLIVWRPHPELHVTARRLLDEINGGKQ